MEKSSQVILLLFPNRDREREIAHFPRRKQTDAREENKKSWEMVILMNWQVDMLFYFLETNPPENDKTKK